MRHILAVLAMLALAVPTAAVAQPRHGGGGHQAQAVQHGGGNRGFGRPGGGGRGGAGPAFRAQTARPQGNAGRGFRGNFARQNSSFNFSRAAQNRGRATIGRNNRGARSFTNARGNARAGVQTRNRTQINRGGVRVNRGGGIQRGRLTAQNRGYRRGPAGGRHFSFRGRSFASVYAPRFTYPRGYRYRRWMIGAILPSLFLNNNYYDVDWDYIGLPPPGAGDEWVRYGPDALLIDVYSGRVVDVAYGVFY